MDFSPLWISLKTALLSTAITFLAGIYAARGIFRMKRGKALLDAVLTLPIVLPPTVLGFFLLIMLGKNSCIGQFLEHFDSSVIFSWPAAVIASVIVSFPLMYRSSRSAFEQLDRQWIDAAKTLGMSNEKIFWRIMLPNAKAGIISGSILAFARAMGEFGATIMVAGNIPGKTQTMSVAIYTAVQSGNRDLAFRWAAIVVLISLLCMAAMQICVGRQGRKAAKT